MKYTDMIRLKLPESTDAYNIDDFNYNAKILDSAFVTQDISNAFVASFVNDGIEITDKKIIVRDLMISGYITFSGNFSGENEPLKLTIHSGYQPALNYVGISSDSNDLYGCISNGVLSLDWGYYGNRTVTVMFSYPVKWR